MGLGSGNMRFTRQKQANVNIIFISYGEKTITWDITTIQSMRTGTMTINFRYRSLGFL